MVSARDDFRGGRRGLDPGAQRSRRVEPAIEQVAGLKRSVLKALGNVQPRHLLDRRLNPPAALRARLGAAAAPAEVVAG